MEYIDRHSDKQKSLRLYVNVLEASNDDSIMVGSREDAAKDIYGFLEVYSCRALLSVAFFIGAVLFTPNKFLEGIRRP